MSLPLLENITEESLLSLDDVDMAYKKFEGDYNLVFKDGSNVRLSNRPIKGLNELFSGQLLCSIALKLSQQGSVNILDLGGGIESRAAIELLDVYFDDDIKVTNLDKYAAIPKSSDSRLKVIRDDFQNFSPSPQGYDIIYSWQMLQHVSGRGGMSLDLYGKISSCLNKSGVAFLEDERFVRNHIGKFGELETIKETISVTNIQFFDIIYQSQLWGQFIFLEK